MHRERTNCIQSTPLTYLPIWSFEQTRRLVVGQRRVCCQLISAEVVLLPIVCDASLILVVRAVESYTNKLRIHLLFLFLLGTVFFFLGIRGGVDVPLII